MRTISILFKVENICYPPKDLPCYQNADGRAYNKVYEDSLEMARPGVCRCSTCHIIPGTPLNCPITCCIVTDGVEKTYFDMPPYTPWCNHMFKPRFVPHTKTQYCCFEFPYHVQYHIWCEPLFGNIIYYQPLALSSIDNDDGEDSNIQKICDRCCTYPVICGVNDTKSRIGGTLSSSLFLMMQGVQILRIHDVDEILQGVKVFKELINN